MVSHKTLKLIIGAFKRQNRSIWAPNHIFQDFCLVLCDRCCYVALFEIMITIRRANNDDLESIASILEELDLGHPSLSFDGFWVVLSGAKIVGVSHIKDCGKSSYLSAVGITQGFQKKGVARFFLNEMLSPLKKNVYVYTRIPDFFAKFGFITADCPAEIPPREIYGCDACEGNHPCTCMVRYCNETTVS